MPNDRPRDGGKRKVPGGPVNGPNANPEKQGTDMKILGMVVGPLVGFILLCVIGHKLRDLVNFLKRKRNQNAEK